MSDGRTDWRRMSRGVLAIGIGVVLLLNTLDVLRWSVWLEALAYWPILLVALGVRLVFDRSRAPALALLSPLLIVGTILWVGYGADREGPLDWTPIRASRPDGIERWTLSGGAAFARLEVEARPLAEGLLVEGRAAARRGPRVRVFSSDETPRVRIDSRRPAWGVILPRDSEDWELGVSPDHPLRLDLETAFTSGRLLLERAPVEDVRLDGAFNRLTVRLGAPAADVRFDVDGAFNALELVVPAETPVVVDADGFMTVVRGARSRSYSGDTPGYRVHLDGAFSSLRVRSD